MDIGKKTIVFDLDETLLHCVVQNIEMADKQIEVTMATGTKVKAGVNIRPFALKFLEELAQHFELIVFTASHPNYADKAIDLLDPNKTIFSKRLFRENCVKTKEGIYIKDLRILNRDPKSVLIVDNAIVSFAFQLDNGVPIIPFYDDKEDNLLLKMKDFLISLKDVEDVRKIIKNTFRLQELYTLDVNKFLKYYYTLDEESDNNREEENDFTYIGSVINKKVQDAVNNHLDKFKEDFPKYFASQNICK